MSINKSSARCVDARKVNKNWKRLDMDITHYRGENYLSLIDCGPLKFALWHQLSHIQGNTAVIRHLQSIFCKRGAPEKTLTDNYTTFRSEEPRRFLENWGDHLKLQAAYWLLGNGIIERNHRTVKRVAEQSKIFISETIYWYNISIDRWSKSNE